MKKLRKLFNLLPAFALAFISGLGVVLDNDHTLKQANADYVVEPNNPNGAVNQYEKTNPNFLVTGYHSYKQDLRLQSFSNTSIYSYNYSIQYGDGTSYLTITVKIQLLECRYYDGTDFVLTNLNSAEKSSVINIGSWDIDISYFCFYIYSFSKAEATYLQFRYFILDSNNEYLTGYEDNSLMYCTYPLITLQRNPNGNAGSESIDIKGYQRIFNAYYDSGYNAGYTAGQNANDYQTGYDEGYSAGWLAGTETSNDMYYQAGYEYGLSVSENFYNTAISNADTNGYNRGYGVGYEEGVASQQQNITDAFNEGYSAGYEIGFNVDSTAATIFSGILQVGMLPINILLAIFNFEILGINLSAFISAILTVCLTVIVVRTVTGGKNSE